MTAALVFLATCIGIALGRIPGLALDRVGIALLGAIAMIVSGAVPVNEAVSAIDLSTILLLYALMIVSAQLRLGGFYTCSASRLTRLLERPRLFLFAVMASSALLSAI
jgi:Na+/H+ antiporter NhaD/arsenite permease-like protein